MWRLADYSKNIAVIDENGKAILYDALQRESETLAQHVKDGRCLIFNLCSNEAGSLIGYVAFVNNNIVPFMLDANIDRNLLDPLLQTYKPAYLWLPEKQAQELSEYEKIYSSRGYTLLRTGAAGASKLHDDLGLLLTTSGSTGSSKLVRQSYANLRANIDSIVEYLEIDENQRSITTLPMNYSYGLSIINTHLDVGASIILTKQTLMQKEFWRQIKEFKATNFGGVPYIYEILKRLRFLRMELPALLYVTQAGGKLSPILCHEYAEGCRAIGKDFIVMYGATEATARMSYVPRAAAVEKAGSIGIAIPGGRFELINDDGSLIDESDKVGELVYYGNNVTMGYAEKSEDLSNPDDRHGRLETGDMAKRDMDGYYYVVGRKKRFLKIYGNRVNLMEVEELLRQQGYESACVGEDDHMRIFTTSENTGEVHGYIAKVTGINRAAFEVFQVDKIHRNSSGKVLYSEFENRAQ